LTTFTSPARDQRAETGWREDGKPVSGIHHVTAIASHPPGNLDFSTEVLGLRLVKRTVNFDHQEDSQTGICP